MRFGPQSCTLPALLLGVSTTQRLDDTAARRLSRPRAQPLDGPAVRRPSSPPAQQPSGSTTQRPSGSTTQRPSSPPAQQPSGSTTQRPSGSTTRRLADPARPPSHPATRPPSVSASQRLSVSEWRRALPHQRCDRARTVSAGPRPPVASDLGVPAPRCANRASLWFERGKQERRRHRSRMLCPTSMFHVKHLIRGRTTRRTDVREPRCIRLQRDLPPNRTVAHPAEAARPSVPSSHSCARA